VRRRGARATVRAAEARRWSGRLPDEQVRRTNGALALAQLDRDLVDGIADLDPATQRAVAVWAVRRACAAVKVVSGHDVTFSVDGVQGNAHDTFTNGYSFSAACPVGVVQGGRSGSKRSKRLRSLWRYAWRGSMMLNTSASNGPALLRDMESLNDYRHTQIPKASRAA